MHKHATASVKPQLPAPGKLFYKIGEVSKITGIEAYVLRYWETEFPFLKPRKNKSGQRVYVKKDLDMILQIKRMLYQERYTLEGVRKRFGDVSAQPLPESKPVLEERAIEFKTPSEAIGYIKKRLRDILSQIK